MKRLMIYLKNNKYTIMILFLFFAFFCFCHFNTFLANDDLPYSFFKRLNVRVTNLYQVLWDNLRYYKSTNGRFIIHCIVMTLLIFGKSLWSILNPLMICTIAILISKIVSKSKKNTIDTIIIILTFFCLFLVLNQFKNIIYWVSGSVNYLWVCGFVFIFIYLILNKNLLNRKILANIFIFILSTLHENSFVFLFIFFLSYGIINYILTKKINIFQYLIPVILGGAVLILAPGNLSRNSLYPEWYAMPFIERLNISIPYVSDSIFENIDFNNIVPSIFIVLLIIKLITLKTKNLIQQIVKIFLLSISVVLIIFNFVFPFRYLTFVLTIFLFLIEIYIHVMEKEYKYIPIQFGFYAIAFSVIITPLYNSLRPNIHLMIYFIFVSSMILIDLLKNYKEIKKILLAILICLSIFLVYSDSKIYNDIGTISRVRISQINKFKNNKKSKILYLKKMPNEYYNYHQDCNSVDENFWTYRWFVWYYDIPNGTKIIYE